MKIHWFFSFGVFFFVGRWYIDNIKPTSTGESQEVKIKVRINANGVIRITSANIVDKKAVKAEAEEQSADNGANDSNNMDTQEVSTCHLHMFLILLSLTLN